MKYLFYPGCSMHASALEYQTSMLAVLETMGAEVTELEDWTCCGASVASVMSDLLGLAMPARNLALAERAGGNGQDKPCPYWWAAARATPISGARFSPPPIRPRWQRSTRRLRWRM